MYNLILFNGSLNMIRRWWIRWEWDKIRWEYDEKVIYLQKIPSVYYIIIYLYITHCNSAAGKHNSEKCIYYRLQGY